MKISKVEYSQVSALSFKDQSYIEEADFLKEFYTYSPRLESFESTIKDRKNRPVDRELLVAQLQKAYSAIDTTASQKSNIESLLDENTFTIITAHQPSLFGGPLYYILKICSVINLCKRLNETYANFKFIPTFVSGGEDHDFEEIDHLTLFGKSVKWNRDAQGPVGRLSTDMLSSCIQEVQDILGSSKYATDLTAILQESLNEVETYGEFVFKFVNQIFGEYGLIVINMDNREFKNAFSPILKKEIIERRSETVVQRTQNALEASGFKAQAFPRDINLFYLGNNDRQRIYFEDNSYKILGVDKSFSEEDMLKMVDDNPEYFSPNVVLRPVYQEYILPNLAYVGGGGEVAYWLERKDQFEMYDTFYPMLVRRNSAMIINSGLQKLWNKLGFSLEEAFEEKDALIKKYIQRNTEVVIDLSDERKDISKSFTSIAEKSKAIDPTLAKAVHAELSRIQKNIGQMESRLQRTLKAQQDVQVKKIEKFKDKLFPNFGLQERHENFMSFYASYGPEWIDFLVQNLDPLDRRFSCIYLD